MIKRLNVTNTDAIAERTPKAAAYYALIDAFTAILEELAADGLSKQARSSLKEKLASRYYALTACDMLARQTSVRDACEAVIDAWRISLIPPASRAEQKAAINKYETEYLREVETNLIEAENGLRMPRLSKSRRKALEDDVTFHGAELVCLEKNFNGLARRRICTRLIDEHKIDRVGPLRYHHA